MAKRPTEPAPTTWLVALTSPPAFVLEGDAPYRPRMLLWKEQGGPLLGFDLMAPSEVATRVIVESFKKACLKPMEGRPRSPQVIHVADPELFDALTRHLRGKVTVRCMPTPEIDEAATMMHDGISGAPGEAPASCLFEGVEVPAIAALYADKRTAPTAVGFAVPGEWGASTTRAQRRA